MDINESSLSRFKTNKSGISRSSSEARLAADSLRIKGTSDTEVQNNKPIELKEGQIIKGRIIDHRYNEVKIQLEPWNQVVTAKLTGDVPLSIDQEANFQVTSGSSDSLILKYIPDEAALPAEVMLQKALMASNLPMTDKNRAIVLELLNNSMPIDKQTLQTLIKLSHTNREASPLTLVLMMKNNIPMTPENIRQFEAYQNGTHQLLNSIRTIAGNLTRLITQPQDLLTAAPSLTDLSPEAISADSQSDSMVPSSNKMNQQDNSLIMNKINQQVNSVVMNQNTASSVNFASDVLTDSYNAINRLVQISGKLIEDLTLNENIPEQPTDEKSVITTGQAPAVVQTNVPSLQTNSVISEQLMNADTSAVLSDFLSPVDRTALLEYMTAFPDTDGIKEQIENGTAPLQKVLSFIQKNLPLSGNEVAGRLLASPEYTRLLEHAFLQRWTITPDKLAKKTPVSDLYKNLQADMEELSNLIKTGGNTEEALKLQEPVKNLQENLQFMKDLNEAFTYLQLPISLKDKQLHSDLYVFTRKKALQEKPDNISVLLHLDMDNLGPLNIYIMLNQKTVKAKFYMANTEAEQLVAANMPSLQEVLSKRGYKLQSEVVNTYKQPDFSRDFIEDTASEGDIKRYTFDIRT